MIIRKWYPILDPAVLQVGMDVKCCLDCADPIYETDDGEEDEGSEHWYTGRITKIFKGDETVGLNIIRNDGYSGDSGYWRVDLNEENLWAIKIHIKEWDE